VLSSYSKTVWLWDTAKGALQQTPESHLARVKLVDLIPSKGSRSWLLGLNYYDSLAIYYLSNLNLNFSVIFRHSDGDINSQR
jgi:hypothetical protein